MNAERAPDGAIIDEDMRAPTEWTRSERVRLITSTGASGTTGSDPDLAFTLGFGTRVSMRVSRYLTLGLRNHVLLRNWGQVSRFYDDAWSCESIDTRCDYRQDFWAIGWALALAEAEAGWDLMFHTEGPNKPWLSAGTAILVYNDTTGFASDKAIDWVVGHTGTLGIGYDREVVGFGLRVSYANNSLLLGTTGPPVLSVLVSVEVLLPRDHGDRRARR